MENETSDYLVKKLKSLERENEIYKISLNYWKSLFLDELQKSENWQEKWLEINKKASENMIYN